MALVLWPSSLPNPTRVEMSPMERRLMSSIDSGLPMTRNLQRDFNGTEDVTWQLTVFQDVIFHGFWRDDLLRGGRFFTAFWPQLNNSPVIARFKKPPSRKYIGNDYWEITAQLELQGTYAELGGLCGPGTTIQTGSDYGVPDVNRPYDLYWCINTGTFHGGETLVNIPVEGPSTEQAFDLVLFLTQHNLGTFPDGPTVSFVNSAGDHHITPPAVTTTVSSNAFAAWYLPSPSAGKRRMLAYEFPGSLNPFYTAAGGDVYVPIMVDAVQVATAHYSARPDLSSSFNGTYYDRMLLSCNTTYL